MTERFEKNFFYRKNMYVKIPLPNRNPILLTTTYITRTLLLNVRCVVFIYNFQSTERLHD